MPGTTLYTAQDIGYLTYFSYNDFVGTTNQYDYYKFSLSGTSIVNLFLSGVTDGYVDARIILDRNNNGLFDSGEQLYFDDATSSSSGQINATLGAGTYFVEIKQSYSDDNSNYSLQLSATSTAPSTFSDPGNTLTSAYNLDNLTGTRSFNDFVGSVDNVDYYKFSLSGTSTVNLFLNGVTDGYVDARIILDRNNNGLFDSGEQLYFDDATSSSSGQINATLGAGTYFVEIKQSYSDDNSNYSLNLRNLSIPDPTSNTKVVRDFNGDRRNDLILQGPTWAGIWTMTGTTPTGWTSLPSTNGAAIRGGGDFTGDGKSDMILQGLGWAGIWTMNGTTVTGWTNLPSTNGATIAGAGDFNGDGKNDLVIQNIAQGWAGIWTMNGATVTGWASLPSTGGARITGIGDFNGDGKSDMTLQGLGWSGIWTMNGVSTSPMNFILLPGTNGETII